MVNGNQLLKMHNNVPSTVLVQGALSLFAELHIIIYCGLYCYKLCGLADHSVVESGIACSRYDFDSLLFFRLSSHFCQWAIHMRTSTKCFQDFLGLLVNNILL